MIDKNVLADVIDAVKLFVPAGTPVQAETMLLDAELIDSMNILQIVVELENRLGMSIGPLDIAFEDFSTPKRIAEAVTELRQQG